MEDEKEEVRGAPWRLGTSSCGPVRTRIPIERATHRPTNRRRGIVIPHRPGPPSKGLPLGPDNVHVRPSTTPVCLAPRLRLAVQRKKVFETTGNFAKKKWAELLPAAGQGERERGHGASVRAATRCVSFSPLALALALAVASSCSRAFFKKDPPTPTEFRAAIEVRVLQEDRYRAADMAFPVGTRRDSLANSELCWRAAAADPECSVPPPRPGKVAELKCCSALSSFALFGSASGHHRKESQSECGAPSTATPLTHSTLNRAQTDSERQR